MNQQEVRAALDHLRSEIQRLAATDGDASRRISKLVADIERQLESPDDQERRAALRDGLPGLIEQLEVEHPDLTTVLSRIITALSSMGV
jgi:hypothetical protein